MFSAAITNWVGLVDIRSAFSCLYCSCSSVKVNKSQVKQYTVYSEKYKFIFILGVFTFAIFKLYCSYTGGILQQLHTIVHSAVTAKTSTVL